MIQKVIDFIQQAFLYLVTFLKLYVANPFIRWWNYYINNSCVLDNARNREGFDFFMKVLHDPSYQPQTPVENYFEYMIEQMYNEYRSPEDPSWEEMRTVMYLDLVHSLLEQRWCSAEELGY